MKIMLKTKAPFRTQNFRNWFVSTNFTPTFIIQIFFGNKQGHYDLEAVYMTSIRGRQSAALLNFMCAPEVSIYN